LARERRGRVHSRKGCQASLARQPQGASIQRFLSDSGSRRSAATWGGRFPWFDGTAAATCSARCGRRSAVSRLGGWGVCSWLLPGGRGEGSEETEAYTQLHRVVQAPAAEVKKGLHDLAAIGRRLKQVSHLSHCEFCLAHRLSRPPSKRLQAHRPLHRPARRVRAVPRGKSSKIARGRRILGSCCTSCPLFAPLMPSYSATSSQSTVLQKLSSLHPRRLATQSAARSRCSALT